MAGQVCVVTGGRGFVGRWLVRKLLATGEWSSVRVVDMAPELRLTDDEANGEGEAGLVRDSALSGQLEYISGNVCDRTTMVNAFQGASAVFHMASPNHALTDLAPHYTVNVLGTPIAKLPADILIPLAGGVEAITKALAPLGLPPSDFTPTRLLLATRWRTFSPARAGRLLGYKPIVSVDEGLQRTIASYPNLQRATYEKEKAAEAAAARAAFRERSSVHKTLGGGVVADLLLWQDAKLSLLAMLLAWMVLRWAVGRVGGTPIVSLAATAAMGFLLHAAVLHRVAPIAKRFRLPLPDMAAVEWRIPEKPVVEASQWVAATWNGSVAALQEKLLVERDWTAAGKVLAALTALQLLSSFITVHSLSFL
ncbi:unnamed protein product, partial [Closterium sp. NIES-54]